MKIFLLLIALCGLTIDQGYLDKLSGNWKMVKVEVKGKTLKAGKRNLYFNVDKNGTVGYYDGCNSCSTNIDSITDNILTFRVGRCTKKLCLIPKDSIENFIDYNGSYILHDSLLIITNTTGKHFLVRH